MCRWQADEIPRADVGPKCPSAEDENVDQIAQDTKDQNEGQFVTNQQQLYLIEVTGKRCRHRCLFLRPIIFFTISLRRIFSALCKKFFVGSVLYDDCRLSYSWRWKRNNCLLRKHLLCNETEHACLLFSLIAEDLRRKELQEYTEFCAILRVWF